MHDHTQHPKMDAKEVQRLLAALHAGRVTVEHRNPDEDDPLVYTGPTLLVDGVPLGAVALRAMELLNGLEALQRLANQSRKQVIEDWLKRRLTLVQGGEL